MIRKTALLIAAGMFLAGCDTVTDLALSSKEAAVKATVKAVEKACDVDEGVRQEVLNLSNLALASGGSPARIHPAFDCDGDGVPDIQ
jgi:hypothetical protein